MGVVYSGTGILMEGMGVSGDNSQTGTFPLIVFIICRPTFILHDKKKEMMENITPVHNKRREHTIEGDENRYHTHMMRRK